MKVSYKLQVKHSQNSGSSKFVMSLQIAKKKVDEVEFFVYR